MTDASPESDDERALLERFTRLVAEHTQTEIARRTATPVSSVNRYLNGTRIPGHMLMALTREFGVAPAWLLRGEGPRYLSDVSADAAETASDMSEIVERMNAVMQFKLGALTGKERQKALRKLGEGIELHRKLRDELAGAARPLMLRTIEEYRAAIHAVDLPLARRLRAEAAQLAPIVNDPVIETEFDKLRARHHYWADEANDALAIHRDIFRRSFVGGSVSDGALLNEAFDYALTLEATGRREEALRVCRAMLLLHGGLGGLPEYAQLRFVAGHLSTELGRARRGLSLLLDGYRSMNELMRSRHLHVLRRGLIIAGAATYADTVELDRKALPGMQREAREVYSAQLLLFCPWFEHEPAVIERAARVYVGDESRLAEVGLPFMPSFVRALLGLRKHGEKAAREFLASETTQAQRESKEGGVRMSYHACACQLLRLAGDAPGAGAELAAADEQVRNVPPGVRRGVLGLATHYRNALALAARGEHVEDELRLRAEAFFRRCARGGAHLFAITNDMLKSERI